MDADLETADTIRRAAMNNKKYIRAAVELADGWHQSKLSERLVRIDGQNHGETLWKSEQYFLDALAAQLVRQVDALGDDVCLEISSTGGVRVSRGMEMKFLATEISPDRTMNTIKAIVDSEVLK